MRLALRAFLCVMVASLLQTGFAIANQNSGIADTEKIYVSPTDIVVLPTGFQVTLNGSYLVVYQLLADANGIFVIPSRSTAVQSWPCPTCGAWNVGYTCRVCGWPN